MTKDSILELLKMVVERNASDLHLTTNLPPMLRIHGNLVSTDLKKLTPSDVEDMVLSLLSETQKQKIKEKYEIDLSYSAPNIGRFRINIYYQRGSMAAAFRLIPVRIPTIEELGLPSGIIKLARQLGGLVLVTGPTGSGKTTTLASMINLINSEKSYHIITIEDPIEYIHPHKKSMVNQREILVDTASFSDALKFAMREDPDVIFVGEMRDLETISTAVTAAETGHLVFATLHTTDTVQTIDRMIDVFPPGQQSQIRMQLSLVLQGVICQRLLPRLDRSGRIVACEVMMVTPAIRNLVRENKPHQIYTIIETSMQMEMQSMNQSLCSLCLDKKVDAAEALAISQKPDELRKMILSQSKGAK